MEWTTSCTDWEDRIVQRQSLITCPPLFPSVADEAWDICSGFLLKDLGYQCLGDVSLPWLRDFVRTVFGSENPETGRRHINEYFLMVSKKNAKSTIAAAIMLCALVMNWRDAAELLILSPTKEIADNSYKPISDFIKADPELSALLKVQDYHRTVTHTQSGATLKVVAAADDTVSGKKASFVFVDELHEFGKQAKASNMLLEATGGLASRPEGFVIYATTQSAEPPAGVFLTKLRYARDVRDGKIQDRKFLPVIYEFPQSMLDSKAYEQLENAYVTNPNWGASVDIERITQLHSQAKASGEKEFKEFLAKHLNVQIGMNLSADRWAGADFWAQNADKAVSLEFILANCEVVTVGIDGGGLDDLLGLTVLGRMSDGKWLAWSHAWAHPSVLERRKEVAPRLQDFAKDGDLTMVKQIGDDLEDVVQICEQVYESGLLDKIGIDPGGIGSILDSLQETGIPHDQIVGVAQTWRLSAAIKTVERKLAGGVFGFAESPMMNWCVGNAKIEIKGSNVYITKQAAGTAKIDPLMSLFNAAYLMAENPEAKGGIDDWLSDPIRTGKA